MNEMELATLEAINPTLNELRVILDMRKMGAHGTIVIQADPDGKFDTWIVTTSAKRRYTDTKPAERIRMKA